MQGKNYMYTKNMNVFAKKAYQFIIMSLLILCFIPVSLADIRFIENKNQWEDNILFIADIPGGRLFVEKDKLTYAFLDQEQMELLHLNKFMDLTINAHAISLEWFNSDHTQIQYEGKKPQPAFYNFFIGKDPAKWASGVKAYNEIYLYNIYPGIDLELISYHGTIKYNFIVHPGADPSEIQLKYSGQDELYLSQGQMNIITSINHIKEDKPVSFQYINDEKFRLNTSFNLEKDIFTFEISDEYDPDQQIIIDPLLIFSTFSGSTADNFGFTATYDQSGKGYTAGTVYATGFPATTGAYQINFAGGVNIRPGVGDLERDIGILKFSDDGTQLLYATYLGGSINEDPHSMIVNSKNQLVLFGTTNSHDFPVTPNAYDTTFNNSDTTKKSIDIFVSILSENGDSLLASTYVGGNDRDGLNGHYRGNFAGDYYNPSPTGFNYGDVYRGEIIIDNDGKIIIATTTNSDDFPVTSGAFQTNMPGNQSGVVIKLDEKLENLLWASYIGGMKEDAAFSADIDDSNYIYVAGGTISFDFPVTSGALDTVGDSNDVKGFVAKFSPDGSQLTHATLLGTTKFDQIYFVKLDPDGNVYVTGQTKGSFPVSQNVYRNLNSGQFIAKLSTDLSSRLISTVFGSGSGNPELSPTAFLVDSCGRIYVSGWGGNTNSFSGGPGGSTNNLPLTQNAYQSSTNGSGFYLALFSKNLENLLYATHMSGSISSDHVDGGTSRFSPGGTIYQAVCAGCGGRSDFPTTSNAYSTSNNSSNCNNLLFKFHIPLPEVIADFDYPAIACKDNLITFTNTSDNATSYFWTFYNDNGILDTSTAENPQITFPDSGIYFITLVATNEDDCILLDTITQSIEIQLISTLVDFTYSLDICENTVQFNNQSQNSTDFTWDFGDSNYSKDMHPVHDYAYPDTFTVTLIADSGTVCQAEYSKEVIVDRFSIPDYEYEINECGDSVYFTFTGYSEGQVLWVFGDGDSAYGLKTSHFYLLPGQYNLSLYSDIDGQCADSLLDTIDIPFFTNAYFTFEKDSCDSKVKFNNLSSKGQTFFWTFGEGDANSDQYEPSHEYQKPGEYTVKLYADSGSVCESTYEQTISLDEFSIADFSYEVEICNGKVNFVFTGYSQTEIYWDFGDGNFGSGDTVEHTFETHSVYFVTVITDSNGPCPDRLTKTIEIEPFPIAAFEYSIDTCTKEVHFENTGNSLSGELLWDFGDGVTSNLYDASHVYNDTGSYFVTLYMDIVHPCTDTISDTIQILNLFYADFIFDKILCKYDIQFDFTGIGATDFYWDFDDGNYSNEAGPLHTYSDPGNYNVSLSILNMNDSKCQDTIYKTVQVEKLAESGFEIYLEECYNHLFSKNNSYSASNNYLWLIDKNGVIIDSSKKYEPDFIFENEGIYFVTLITDPASDCPDSLSKSILIEKDYNPETFYYDVSGCEAEYMFYIESFENNILWDLGNDKLISGNYISYIFNDHKPDMIRLIIDPYTVCADTIDQKIEILLADESNIIIPNVFTPDGDKLNDVYSIKGLIEDCFEYEFLVYNRWGELVFETKTSKIEWDGTTQNNKPLVQGVYYYIFNSPLYSKSGTITIIR